MYFISNPSRRRTSREKVRSVSKNKCMESPYVVCRRWYIPLRETKIIP